MNRDLVENILRVVKTSTDKGVVVKALVKLRADVVKDEEGVVIFREAGGVAPMVRFLNRPNERILEIALSILGNACTDPACCNQAFQCKVISPLTTILKAIPNPTIQNRACRLLGNLAKFDCEQLLASHCPAIAQNLCQILLETNDVKTRVMAARACRFSLRNPQFFKHFLEGNGFITVLHILDAVMKNDVPLVDESLKMDIPAHMLGLKNNQPREKYFVEVIQSLEGPRRDIFKNQQTKNSPEKTSLYALPKEKPALDLACELLSCLLTISELKIGMQYWQSLHHSSVSFAPVVYFACQNNKHRGIALKILSNFSKSPEAFNMLSVSNAILATCELLVAADKKHLLSESETRHCMNVLCMFSRDACNRSKIRLSGALKKIVEMIKESHSHTEKSMILYILNNFEYDNKSVIMMAQEGLITVLVKELSAYVNDDDEYHKSMREERQKSRKKRKLSVHATENSKKLIKKNDEPLFDFDSPSSSPRSNISPSSPCSSRSLSPVGSISFRFDDAETYSPVCSDDEGDDDEEANRSNEAMETTANTNTGHEEVMRLLDIACRTESIEDNLLDRDDDEASEDVPALKPSQLETSFTPIDIVENLLFRITIIYSTRYELCRPLTITTLINAIQTFGSSSIFTNCLSNILVVSQFFAQIIKQGVCHQLFQFTKVKELRSDGFSFLDTLTCVCESNYGKGELASLLRSGDEKSQKRAAIGVAYLIKSQRLLYQFLNDGNALTLLLKVILSQKDDEFIAEAADALTCMSRYTLGISLPLVDATKRNAEYEEFIEPDTQQPMHADCDMRFLVHDIVDDDVIVMVPFNKQLLCDTSVVFNTMLNSDFREGKEGEIHLKGYTVGGVRYFLNLMLRHAHQLKANIPPAHQYRSLLEAFELSRVYIMPAMEQELQQLLCALLDEQNCLSVFEWSLSNYHTGLTDTTIRYYLCSSLPPDAKTTLFRKADNSKYASEWFQMIVDAVLSHCNCAF